MLLREVRLPAALVALNAAACSLFIAFGVARHAPLEAFPQAWRHTIIRWRKAHSRKALTARGAAAAPQRDNPYGMRSGDAKFKAWPELNDDLALAASAGASRRQRLEAVRPPFDRLFAGDSLQCRLSRALGERRALDRKEFFETWELFEQVRASLRGAAGCATLVEVAGGHGLLGLLAATFERRRFDEVLIADLTRPASFGVLLEATCSVAPWVADTARVRPRPGRRPTFAHDLVAPDLEPRWTRRCASSRRILWVSTVRGCFRPAAPSRARCAPAPPPPPPSAPPLGLESKTTLRRG